MIHTRFFYSTYKFFDNITSTNRSKQIDELLTSSRLFAFLFLGPLHLGKLVSVVFFRLPTGFSMAVGYVDGW